MLFRSRGAILTMPVYSSFGDADEFLSRHLDWLKERVFFPGAREVWTEHIASATGEPLNPRYFVEASTATPDPG